MKNTRKSKIYESLTNASASLGIPVDVLKAAKRAGCPCFKPGNRIAESGLLDWISSHQPEMDAATSGGSLKDEKTREEIRKLRIKNDEAEGLVVRKSDVVAEVQKIADPIRAMLRQKLEQEYPLAVASMDVPQARIFGKRLGDEILKEHAKLFGQFGLAIGV